jgi:hypothetical protein
MILLISWPEVFQAPLVIIALAFIFYGFPKITIGGKHETHHHYHGNENDINPEEPIEK